MIDPSDLCEAIWDELRMASLLGDGAERCRGVKGGRRLFVCHNAEVKGGRMLNMQMRGERRRGQGGHHSMSH